MYQRIVRRLAESAFLFLLFAGLSAAASAGFQSLDTTTQGNWKGAYGQDGYIIANDSNSTPSYAAVATSGALAYTWWPSSSDPRALLKGASATDRIASTYYTDTSLTFDVNLTDGQTHQIALYCLDLDTSSRGETISILDASNNAVLDTRSLTNFHNGVYAIWNIQGRVLIRVTKTAGLNAVVSGLFFRTPGGGTPPPTVSISSPTGGTVSGVVSLSATASASSPATMASVQFKVDGIDLGGPVTGSGPTFSTSWGTTSATNTSHTLTAVATDSLGQKTSSAAVSVTVSNSGGVSAPAATFVSADTTAQGNWKGVYGLGGYIIPNDSNVVPAYVTVTASGATPYTWASSSTDSRALLKGASLTDRIASAFYTNTTFSFDMDFTDGQAHQVAIYFLDLEGSDRVETVTIRNSVTSAVLDQRSMSNFHNGVYEIWNVQGHVKFEVTHISGLSGVVSGIFFGATGVASGPPTVSVTSPTGGSTVQNTVTVTANAAATGATMSSVQFLLDGATLGAPVLGSGPYSTSWNTTGATNANHTLSAIATDSLNRQTTSAGISVTVANGAPPTVSISNPAGGSTLQNTLTVTANAAATGATMSSVQFLLDGASLGAPVLGAGPYSTSWNTTGATNGNHTLSATATDSLNRQTTSAGVSVTVANGPPPTVSITSPAGGSTVQNTLAVTANAAATGATITSVQFLLDGAALGAAVLGAGPYSTSWNTTGATNGNHTLSATATDSLSRQTTSAGVSVTVANATLPSVTISSPTAGSTVQNSVNLTATAAATAPGATMSSVQFVVDGNNVGSLVPGAGPTFLLQWASATVSNGSHTVTAIATDSQNHQATSAGVSVTVANGTPPAVSITAPTANSTIQSGSTTITATATANLATMSSVQFQVDGVNLGAPVAGTGPTYSTTWNLTSASNGVHTLAAIATDSLNRQTTSANVSVTVSIPAGPVTPAASFVKTDAVTQGNWKNTYGQDGAIIANDVNLPPASTSVSFVGTSPYSWLSSTADSRALLKGASVSDRIASAYYTSGSFTIDLNLTASAPTQVALYCLDWDTSTRSQTISILDSRNNAVLDTQSVSNFHNGVYLVWNLKGHVIIKVTNTGSLNGVVSGIFFRSLAGLTPPTVSISSPTGGTVSGPVTITTNVSSPQGVSSVQFQLDGVNLGAPVTIAPYSLPWATPTAADGVHTLRAIATDMLGLATTSTGVTVTISNGPPPIPTAAFVGSDATTSGSWVGSYGQDGFIIANDITQPPFYATVDFNGAQTWTWHAADPTTDLPGLQKSPTSTQRIGAAFMQTFNANSSSNPPLLIDVNFVDNQTHQFSMYFVDWHHPVRTQVIEVLDPNTQTILDSQTISAFFNGIYLTWNLRGHIRFRIYITKWYGWPDYSVAPDSVVASGLFFNSTVVTPTVPPPTVSITAPTTNQNVAGTFTVTANAQSQASIDGVQFRLDGANLGPVITGVGPTYSYQWNTTGVTNGLHMLTAVATDSPFHQRTTSAAVQFLVGNAAPSTSATFVGTDIATKGSWKGVYGQDGYIIPIDSNNPPAYATTAFTGAAQLAWAITSDPRALQQSASTTNRIASVYYGAPNFTLDLNLGDSLSHRLALYLLDWDGAGRAETITIIDANTLQVLDTRTASGFGGGTYLIWSLKGHVLIQFNRTAGPNAVVSGVFLAP